MNFLLDPRLQADTVFVADWPLSRVLLMDDARFPWIVLVPRRAAAVELFDLAAADRATLGEETVRAAQGLKRLTGCAKINVGALGNLVAQLHVHVVARNPGDVAWPGPVWGSGARQPYVAEAYAAFLSRLVNLL
jgi:diadenosine tetraphosphate (Ap4A) HIT family hydrolase